MAADERPKVVEPLDENDVALLRFLRSAHDCRRQGAACPAADDCPEGFLICDALVNMLEPGTTPSLGPTAREVVRFLYHSLDCKTLAQCPADVRCGEGEDEPCRTLLRKLGVEEA
ncbi:MAG: hypothetical protein ACYC4L_08455 [Chloroflexota bacterium]